MAPIGGQHELIISHGNGPQIGPLALGETAYAAGLRRAAKATSIAHEKATGFPNHALEAYPGCLAAGRRPAWERLNGQ